MSFGPSSTQDFRIRISLQPDGVKFDISNLDNKIRSNRIHSFKCLRSLTLGCKDVGIRTSEFVAKT